MRLEKVSNGDDIILSLSLKRQHMCFFENLLLGSCRGCDTTGFSLICSLYFERDGG